MISKIFYNFYYFIYGPTLASMPHTVIQYAASKWSAVLSLIINVFLLFFFKQDFLAISFIVTTSITIFITLLTIFLFFKTWKLRISDQPLAFSVKDLIASPLPVIVWIFLFYAQLIIPDVNAYNIEWPDWRRFLVYGFLLSHLYPSGIVLTMTMLLTSIVRIARHYNGVT